VVETQGHDKKIGVVQLVCIFKNEEFTWVGGKSKCRSSGVSVSEDFSSLVRVQPSQCGTYERNTP
jgi:hypothetical protein